MVLVSFSVILSVVIGEVLGVVINLYLANTVAFLAFIPIPLYFIYAFAKWGKSSFYPTAEWGAREQAAEVQSETLQKGIKKFILTAIES